MALTKAKAYKDANDAAMAEYQKRAEIVVLKQADHKEKLMQSMELANIERARQEKYRNEWNAHWARVKSETIETQ